MTDEDRKKSCAELIYGKLQGRIAQMKGPEEKEVEYDEGGEEIEVEDDEDEDENGPMVYHVQKILSFKLELSGGGPSDYFIIEVDPDDKTCIDAEYHYLDWFDGATRSPTGTDLNIVLDWAEQYNPFQYE